jgi:hypothetical protein
MYERGAKKRQKSPASRAFLRKRPISVLNSEKSSKRAGSIRGCRASTFVQNCSSSRRTGTRVSWLVAVVRADTGRDGGIFTPSILQVRASLMRL